MHDWVVRRSSMVSLTLLPMLASAVVAADPPPVEQTTIDAQAPDALSLSPPGMTDPILAPPGMTPPFDLCECRQNPGDDRCDPAMVREAAEACDAIDDPWVIRGGFGNYFWTGG
jgi:hypothetical protein